MTETEREDESPAETEPGDEPSTPDESVPSEEDAEQDLPGVPEEAEG